MSKWSNPFKRRSESSTPPASENPATLDPQVSTASGSGSPELRAARAELAELLAELDHAEASATATHQTRDVAADVDDELSPELRAAILERAAADYGQDTPAYRDYLRARGLEVSGPAVDEDDLDSGPYSRGVSSDSSEMAVFRARLYAQSLYGRGTPGYFEHLREAGLMNAEDEAEEAAQPAGVEAEPVDSGVSDYLTTSIGPGGDGGIEASVSIDYEALFESRLNKVVAGLGDRIGDDVEAIREDLAAGMRAVGFHRVTSEDMASLAADMSVRMVGQVEVAVHRSEP